MSFLIEIIDRRRRIALIEIGKFSETFQISGKWPLAKYESEWRRQLVSILERKRKALLPEAATGDHVFRAWILYRDSKNLYVQERFYIRQPFRYGRSRIHPRKIRSEDGPKLSEWSVPLKEVEKFLKRSPNHQQDVVDPNPNRLVL